MMKSEKKPEVSVITVCYNLVKAGRVSSFRNCVESVRSQLFEGVEHLVIDGGSKDGTIELLRSCERPGFRWFSEKDNGIYDAMNKGIKLARGKYIAFINSDDALSDNGAVAEVVKALRENGADFAYANANVYSADHSQFLRIWESRIDDIPYGYYPCHQTIFCRADALRELGGFEEKYMANDNQLMLKLVMRYRACYLNRVIVDFHEGGASGEMVADKERMKKETVSFFYDEAGRASGLTKDECAVLYERKCFSLSMEECLDLGSRLALPVWRKRHFTCYLDMFRRHVEAQCANEKQEARVAIRFKLFGKLPLFRVDL